MTSMFDGGPSPEALRKRHRYVPDVKPIDFDQIEQRRAQAKADFAPAVDRAIERHGLVLEDVDVAGVSCLRITSTTGGTANGRLLYIFGGGFVVGDPDTDIPVSGALGALCGVEVIAPRYRLAPEHCAPAAGDDCWAVYSALASVPGRLLLAGESAGGNLALLTAQRAAAEGIRMASGLALLSPAADLRTDRDLFGTTIDQDPSLSYQLMVDVAKVYPGEFELDDPALSPALGSMDGLAPTVITTGSRDLLMEGSIRLARKLRLVGVDVTCNVWPGLWHVFEFYDEIPEAAESLRDIASFLNACSPHESQT